jgi:dTDP-L-rhamnose 4-epimerase
MNILVTGGAGFIGTRLTENLIREGHKVRILDNFNSQIHDGSVPSNLNRLSDLGAEIVVGNICSEDNVRSALKDVESIVHLASETGTGQSMYKISQYADTNIMGTCNLVEQIIAVKTHINHFVLASTRAVYGEGKYLCNEHGFQVPQSRDPELVKAGVYDPTCRICEIPMIPTATDEHTPTNPTSIYGITKLAQEQIAMSALNCIGIDTVALRLQNVYGPGQSLKNPYTGILSIFSKQMMSNLPIYIFEDGKESRDFVYIDDVVRAIQLSLIREEMSENIFNIGCGSMTTVIDIVHKLKNIFQSKSEIIVTGEYRMGDIRHNYSDNRRSLDTLNFLPVISLDQGLLMFSDWALKQPVSENEYEKSLSELRTAGLLQG